MNRGFVVFMIGFLVGILLCDMFLIGVGLGAFVFWKFCRGDGWQWFLLIFVVGLVVGAVRVGIFEIVPEDDVRRMIGQDVDMEVCVNDEVDVRQSVVKYIVSSTGEGGSAGFEGKVLVSAARYPVYEYGDVLRVSGVLEEAGSFEGFDYGEYLERFGVYGVVNSAVIRKVGDGCGWLGYEWIFRFKGVLEERISVVFPEPYSSMVAGLLLGSRKGIPPDLTLDFNETGLTHIVAISGYNITLVIVIVFSMFGFVSRRKRVVFAVTFVVVFVVLVGASSAVVRAGIMGVCGLMALYFGRKSEVLFSILFAAFVMNLFNPRVLVADVGFQLSFLATLGLVYVAPWFEGRFLRLPATFMIRENIMMTLSAQTFALPVILKNFGRVSLICPIANVFVLPLIPISMILSFLAVVLSFVSVGLGKVFAFGTYLVLDLVFFLVRVFADLSRLIS